MDGSPSPHTRVESLRSIEMDSPRVGRGSRDPRCVSAGRRRQSQWGLCFPLPFASPNPLKEGSPGEPATSIPPPPAPAPPSVTGAQRARGLSGPSRTSHFLQPHLHLLRASEQATLRKVVSYPRMGSASKTCPESL